MNILMKPCSTSGVFEPAALAPVPVCADSRDMPMISCRWQIGRIKLRVWALLFCAIWATGCNTTEKDWKAAKEADTSPAYTGFLTQHPQGPHADEAKAAIENLDWKTARSANTSAAYTAFLVRHPQESHAGDARAAKAAAESVTGKTYMTSEDDMIEFGRNGRAVEINGNPGVAYAGQMVSFDGAGRLAGTPCTYNQDGEKVTLRCEPGATAVYTVSGDGSLQGPPAGMYKHPAFAHLTERK